MIKAVVLDLDDTLYDEIDYCKSGFLAVAEFLSKRPKMPPADQIFTQLHKIFMQGNHKTVFNSALDQLSVAYDQSLIATLVGIYRKHKPAIALPLESRKLLDQLGAEYILALLTDGFMPAQRLKVEALNIEKYFACIVYTEELGGKEFWKPSPAGLKKIITQININPSQIAYIADNTAKDFIAPNQLGCPTIQLIRPARIHKKSPPDPIAAPQHILYQPELIPFLLRSL